MVDADLADQIRLEIQQKYPPKHGSLSRFCDDKGFNNSRVSDALNPDVDTKVSTLIAIADALDCDVILEPRDK